MNKQVIDPQYLAIWVKSLRMCKNLSQEALAAAANIDVRSIQRVESGQRISLQTRRSIARALEFEDVDAFDNPEAVSAFTDFMEELGKQAEHEYFDQIRNENPDAIEIEAEKMNSAKSICLGVAAAEGLHFTVADGLDADIEETGAEMADWLRDYGDIDSDLNQSQRLDFHRSFQPYLDRLNEKNVSVFHASRRVRLGNRFAPEMEPFDWSIAYFHLASSPHEKVKLFVSKMVAA